MAIQLIVSMKLQFWSYYTLPVIGFLAIYLFSVKKSGEADPLPFISLSQIYKVKGRLHQTRCEVLSILSIHCIIGTKDLSSEYEVSKSQFSDNDTYSQVLYLVL